MPSPADMPGATPEPDAIIDDPTPVATAPAEPEPATGKKDKAAPPWGSDDDFQPDKAWKLIQNLRAEAEQYKNKAAPSWRNTNACAVLRKPSWSRLAKI